MPQLILLNICIGIASHLAVYIRKEHHLQAAILLRIYAVAYFVIWFGCIHLNGETPYSATISTTTMALSYCFGLFGSMITYRLFFHQLNSFPGPAGAKVSKLWHLWQVRRAKQYLVLHELHNKYGDFVRTGEFSMQGGSRRGLFNAYAGPNEICVFRPEAVKSIHGYGSQCTKSAWYDMLKPYTAMNTTRSRLEHDKRRRAYESGLSIKGSLSAVIMPLKLTLFKAVQGYQTRVLHSANDLDNAFSQLAGQPMNISVWFQYFAFDVMGELGFGKTFNQVRTAKSHFETDFLRNGMSLLAIVTPVPWLYHLGCSIPGLTRDWEELLSWSARQAERKVSVSLADE